MNRRKASREGNRGQIVPARRLSMVNLRSKTSNVIQRHQGTENSRLKSVRSGSRQNDRSADRNGLTTKNLSIVDGGMPKVRFSADNKLNENRPNSSPRLKHFPAETIRKFDNAPMFPPRSTVDSDTLEYRQKPISLLISEQKQNQGHGDTPIDYSQISNQSQIVTTNQQHLPNTQEIGNVNQSEAALLSQNTCLSPGRQAHRPFVPNIPHGMAVRDRSPLIPTIASYQSPTQTIGNDSELQRSQQVATVPQQMQPTADITFQQHQQPQQQQQQQQQSILDPRSRQANLQNIPSISPWKSDDTTEMPDYEKQPVGGKNALVHRRVFMQQKNQVPQAEQMQQQSNQSTYWPTVQRNTNMSQDNDTMLPVRQVPQENFQQMQHSVAQQQQQQQREATARQQATERSWVQQPRIPAQQMQIDQKPCGNFYAMQQGTSGREFSSGHRQQLQQQQQYMSSPNGWVQNNRMIGAYPSTKAQLNPYVVDLVNSGEREVPREEIQYQQFKQNESQPMVSQQQTAKQWQLQHQQYHPYQSYQQHQQYSDPTWQNAARTSNLNLHQQQQIDARWQGQVRQQQPQQRKKRLEFTPEMIRDQELLVSNMRQQKISEDVMRRQFDTLLNEQRKQLMYLEQLQQEPAVLKRGQRVVRRITKIQDEQKPEWMMHITPPRISYCDMEKMKCVPDFPADKLILQERQRQEKERIQQHDPTRHMSMQPRADSMPTLQMQSTQQQLRDPAQQDAYQLCQQQTTNWQQRFNFSPSPYSHMSPQPYVQMGSSSVPDLYQTNGTFRSPYDLAMHQHVQQPPKYFQYSQHSQGQQQQETPNSLTQFRERVKPMDASKDMSLTEKHIFQQYQEDVRNVESSSLLKLKKYKEVIRPQRQNNGLQDPETVREALEALKKLENRRGLEYLANLNKKEIPVRLNGAQDPSETAKLPAMLPLENRQQQQQKISANGLENGRNPNNPALQLISYSKNPSNTPVFEYPRQKQTNSQPNGYNPMVESKIGNTVCSSPQSELQQRQPIYRQAISQTPHSGQAHPRIQTENRQGSLFSNERNPMSVSNFTTMPYRSDQWMPPQCYQQIQQYYLDRQNLKNNVQGYMPSPQYPNVSEVTNVNHAGGDAVYQPIPVYSAQGLSQIERNKLAVERYLEMRHGTNGYRNYRSDICQPITIGGLTYLARAPNSIPKSSPILPETSIPSKYLRPTVKSD